MLNNFWLDKLRLDLTLSCYHYCQQYYHHTDGPHDSQVLLLYHSNFKSLRLIIVIWIAIDPFLRLEQATWHF